MDSNLSQNGGAKTSPYVALYSLQLRQAIPLLDDKSLRLLMTLMTYVNGEGVCWPGYRALAEVTGYRHETIQSTLDKLVSTGFVRYKRRNAVDPYTKQKLPNIYQIVGLMHMRSAQATPHAKQADEDYEAVAAAGREYDQISEATAAAEPAPSPSPFAQTTAAKVPPSGAKPVPPTNSKPEQNQQHNQNQQTSFVKPESENQQQQPSKTEKAAQVQKSADVTGTGPNTEKMTAKVAASDSSESKKAEPEKTKAKPDYDAVPNEAYFQQRASAKPAGVPRDERRQNLDCENFAVPLPDSTLEQFAKRVHNEVKPITLPNARRLVGTYGTPRVEAALTHLSRLSNIYNPPGFLVMLLRRSEVDAEADGPYKARSMEEEFDEIAAKNYQTYVAGWEDYIDH